jgi:hypothetical protein
MTHTPRWKATITYSTDGGPNEVVHDFEELYALHNLVERGPDWNAIIKIEIVLADRSYDVTVEEAKTI